MARMKTLFSLQWRMYERCLSVNSMRKTERLVASWMAFVVCIRYVVNTIFIFSTFSGTNQAFGLPLLEFNLMYVGIILLIGPFLLRTILAAGFTVNAHRLNLACVTPREMFQLKITEIVFRPSFIIMCCFSFFSVSLFMYTEQPFIGIVLGCFYVFFCISISLFLTTVAADFMENATVKGMSSVVLAAFALLLINANYSFSISGSDLYVSIATQKVLLWNTETGGGLISDIGMINPASWIVSGAMGNGWIFTLLILLFVILFLLTASFLAYTVSAKRGLSRKKRILPREKKSDRFVMNGNRTFVILIKQLRQIISEPVYRFCFAAIVVLGALSFVKDESIAAIIVPGIFIAYIIESRLFFNIFGYDTYAMDRYRLAPVSGIDIYKPRNAALCIAMLIQFIPFMVMSIISHGIVFAVIVFLVSCCIWILYIVWGNISSLLLMSPAFVPDGTRPAASDKFLNICISILPLVAINYIKDLLVSTPLAIRVLVCFFALFLCGMLYAILISRQGRYLETKIEDAVNELASR